MLTAVTVAIGLIVAIDVEPTHHAAAQDAGAFQTPVWTVRPCHATSAAARRSRSPAAAYFDQVSSTNVVSTTNVARVSENFGHGGLIATARLYRSA